MYFTAIDFETANSNRASACAVGIAVVENGKIIRSDSCLIKPKSMKFDPVNISIHGITPDMVANEPEFDEVWTSWIFPALRSAAIVAHNASFDTSVMRKSFCEYGIESPELDYFCTFRMGKALLPELGGHSLGVVADALGVDVVNHHDPKYDAIAAAELALAMCDRLDAPNLPNAIDSLKLNTGKMWHGGWLPCGKGNKPSSYDPGPIKTACHVVPLASRTLADKEALNELNGLIQGILADGKVVKSEAEFFLQWLSPKQTADGSDPIKAGEVVQLLLDVLEDDELTPAEALALEKALKGLSSNVAKELK